MSNNIGGYLHISNLSMKSSLNKSNYWVICPKCKMNIPSFTLFISSECPQINITCSCSEQIQIMTIKDYIDFLLKNPVAINSQVCNRHSDREAPVYCYMCQEYLCKPCHLFHKEKCDTHFISSKPISPQSKCIKHNKEFETVYCTECSKSICHLCLSEDDKTQHDNDMHKHQQCKTGSQLWEEINAKNIREKCMTQRKNIAEYTKVKDELLNSLTALIDKFTRLKMDIELYYKKFNETNEILNHFIDICLWHFADIIQLPNFNIMNSINTNIVINEAKLDLIQVKESNDTKSIEDNANKLIAYFKEKFILQNNIQCLNAFQLHSMGVNRVIELNDGKMASSSFECIIWDKSPSKPNLRIIKQIDTSYINIEALVQLSNGRIAIGASDKLIKVYDQFNGVYLGMFQGHDTWINVLYQLKDERLVSGSYQSIKLWDIQSYKCIGVLDDNIGGCVFSLCQLRLNDSNNDNDDGALLSGSEDGLIRQWDINDLKLIKRISGHDGWVNCIIRLQDRMIATGGSDRIINVWNETKMKYIKTLSGNEDKIICLCQLKDKRLLAGSLNVIKVWNVNTNQCIVSIIAHDDYITDILTLRDGSVATASKDKLIKLWSI